VVHLDPGRCVRLVAAALVIDGTSPLPAEAQTHVWTVKGENFAEGLGADVAWCGDVDADGFADLLVAAVPNAGHAGKAFVYSSTSAHAMLLEFDGDAADDHFGRHVGDLGDVDGDGLGDYAVAAPDRVVAGAPLGAVFVWSGTGARLRLITSASGAQVGVAMCVVGDLDGDGVRDLLYSESGANPAVVLASGATGATIRTHTSSVTTYGYAIGAVGDVDADGFEDYAICEDPSGSGKIHVHSGSSGTLLFDYVAAPTWIKTAGDTNGDGNSDLLFSRVGSGVVTVVSGATGSKLRSFSRNSETEFGRSASTFGDLDGDGKSDIVLSRVVNPFDPFEPHYNVGCFSGATGSLLRAWNVVASTDAMDGTKDADGDGVHDVLVGGATTGDQGNRGIFTQISGAGSWTRVVGTGFISQLAFSLAIVGDRDGDGWRDVAVAARGGLDVASGAVGAVEIVSGQDGHELSRFSPASQMLAQLSYEGRDDMTAIGDVDGDGVEDLALLCAGPVPGGFVDTRAVELHSGADDSLLMTIVPPSDVPVALASAQELNGAPLLAIATANYPRFNFYVYDLSTGAIVTQQNGFGGNVACMGDVDQDGKVDWLLQDLGSKTVVVLTGGATPTTLWSYGGAAASLASVHDLNGDGVDDVLVGDNGTAAPVPGKVTVLSGVDGTKLFTVQDTTPYTAFGLSVASLDDLNRDGYGDFAVGALSTDNLTGAIHVYSGRTATLLYRFEGELPFDYLGENFATSRWHEERSLDPDGIPDLVTGVPDYQSRVGRAFAFRMDDLLLRANPSSATAGVVVDVSTRGGPTGKLVGLFAVDFSGTPLNYFIAFGTFDGSGDWLVSGAVPAGLSGNTLTLRSYALGFNGKVVDSQDATLTFL
jgi:hypothetical protein